MECPTCGGTLIRPKGGGALYCHKCAAADPNILRLLEACRKVRDIAGEMTGTGREATFGLRLYEAVDAVTRPDDDPEYDREPPTDEPAEFDEHGVQIIG